MLNKRNQYKALVKWFNRKVRTRFLEQWLYATNNGEITQEMKQAAQLVLKLTTYKHWNE